jgi:hypothetical protein
MALRKRCLMSRYDIIDWTTPSEVREKLALPALR